MRLLPLLISAGLIAYCVAGIPLPPHRGHTRSRVHQSSIPASRAADPNRPGVHNCTEHFFEQRLDHFGFLPPNASTPSSPTTYMQRYFVCLEHNFKPNGTIFYYTGNEADVVLFVNMTGLMWENADEMGAMLVFAEHRYFGKSLPYPGDAMPTGEKLAHLSTDQALADYAAHIQFLRESRNSVGSPVIGFGGSYGGMLCAWLRIKYPSALDGCIAGSAPIVNFEYMEPPFDSDAFSAIETLDASTAGGASDTCKSNIRRVWNDMLDMANTPEGLNNLGTALQLCSPPRNVNDVWNLIDSASSAIAMMSMSSYPYPSAYLLLGGAGKLPAYPMRVGCKFMDYNFTSALDRVTAFGKFSNVYFNATKNLACINASAAVNYDTEVVNYLWNYLYCTTMFQPFGQNGVTDMFWPSPWNSTASKQSCYEQYGVWPQAEWVQIQYGGRGVSNWGSNIVFSNGHLDPWRPGGIQKAASKQVRTVIIPDAGHHIDLMWSDPKDTPAIRGARALEVNMIKRWISEKVG